MTYTATYSPDDNKLRLYASERLDAETYERAKAAGFKWAPKQELFVAPMWTPARADLLLDLAGEIEDEDKSLSERAEERAERFENISEKRAGDYERAKKHVDAIAGNIPFGQPILVGHHSEKRARKDAQKIENGIKHAVKMWEQSEYWEQRAKSAISHAKYKELPGVRARRIKTIEADKRKSERTKADAEKFSLMWSKCPDTEKALLIANYDYVSACFTLEKYPRTEHTYEGSQSLWSALGNNIITWEQARDIATRKHGRTIKHCDRWIEHFENRLIYERAMLGESGGLADEKFDIQIGGQVLTRGEWVTVLKINKVGGKINSLGTNARYCSKVGIEKVQDYRPPTEEQTANVKAATAKAPLCNYPAETIGIVNRFHGTTDMQLVAEMTKAEWDAKHKDYKTTRDVPATDTTARHRVRYALISGGSYKVVYITDEKRKDPPPLDSKPAPAIPPVERVIRPRQVVAESVQDDKAEEVQELKDSLKAGVQVAVAPQLFPTPPEIAEKMANMLDVQPGDDVLEPSAGTGNLLGALGCKMFGHDPERGSVTAVEINQKLAGRLQGEFPLTRVLCHDFLESELVPVDKIIMNPPFDGGADIKHINHAFNQLKPGGKLVALCANGPRQQAAFQDTADHWEALPTGSFASQGTNVNVALLVMSKPAEAKPEPTPPVRPSIVKQVLTQMALF